MYGNVCGWSSRFPTALETSVASAVGTGEALWASRGVASDLGVREVRTLQSALGQSLCFVQLCVPMLHGLFDCIQAST